MAKKKKQPATKQVTDFKLYCLKNHITQAELAEKTGLSVGCIHGLWKHGKATKSTLKLVSLVYKINEAELTKMVKGTN